MVKMDENLPDPKLKKTIGFVETDSKPSKMETNTNVTMRSSVPSENRQSASIRRRSLNISHYNAVQGAVSTLARIDDFDLESLGYGFFSDVFKVTHKQTGKVMVLKRNRDTNTKMNILREVQLMNRLSHPNILKFIGVCVHEGKLHALTEYINGGDLDQLVTKKNVVIPWKQRMKLSKDIASGMSYLHSVGIFHRDLTAKNCLVRSSTHKSGTAKMTAVVADLGLAEKIPTTPEEERKLSIVGTPYIIAPESLHGKPYNETCDMFSYGIVTCQLIALISCDPEELPRSRDFGLARDLFLKLVSASPQQPTTTTASDSSLPPPKDYLQLAFDCCLMDPKSRPPFKEILVRLENMLQAYRKRAEPKRSSSFKGGDVPRHRPTARLCDTLPRRKGVSGKSTETTEGGSSPLKVTLRAKQGKRHGSASRLSRSFSDISRELLSHAANMVASSSCTFDDAAESDVFSNPFSALEHLEGGKRKLIDEPSLALLEMTFELSNPSDLRSMWQKELKTPTKSQRPRSYFSGETSHSTVSPPSTLHPLSPPHTLHHSGSSSPGSPRPSSGATPDHGKCRGCDYQRAKHRAMLLSPRGNDLASWWCMRKRAEGEKTENERQSLASVVSVLSRNLRSSRRCISLPDLSRIHALFHQISESHEMTNVGSTHRNLRSNASTEHVFTISNPNSIKEENESEEDDKSTSFTTLDTSDTNRLEPSVPSDQKTSTSTDCSTSTCPEPMNPTHVHSQEENTLTKSDSISSASSGCSSSSGLAASMHAAELSQRKRRPEQPDAHEKENRSLNNNNTYQVDNHVRQRQPKSTNRDSGYEDTVLASLEEHHNYPRDNCPSTWCIKEDPRGSQPPITASVMPRCGLGARPVTDWNSNENALQTNFNWPGDTV